MVKSLITNQEFIRFLLVGGFAALVNFFSRILINNIYTFRISVIIAYIIGMLTAYILTKFLVFTPSGQHPVKEFSYFAIVNGVAIIQVWAISVVLAEYLFPIIELTYYPKEIAHFIGISIPVITSYYGHKYFSFKSN
jgi:putative flippase GtrA